MNVVLSMTFVLVSNERYKLGYNTEVVVTFAVREVHFAGAQLAFSLI